jgi:hypothetical protein
MCFLIFKQISLKHLLFQEELTGYYDNSKYFFNEISEMFVRFQWTWFFSQISGKESNSNFHENFKCTLRVIGIINTDITEKTLTIRNSGNLPEIVIGYFSAFLIICMIILTFTFN